MAKFKYTTPEAAAKAVPGLLDKLERALDALSPGDAQHRAHRKLRQLRRAFDMVEGDEADT